MNYGGGGDSRVQYGLGPRVRNGRDLEAERREAEAQKEKDLAWLNGFGSGFATDAPLNNTDAYISSVTGEAVPGRVTTGRAELEQALDALVPGWRNDPYAFESAMDSLESWAEPFNNISRLLGAAVNNVSAASRGDYESVVNPLADSGNPQALNAPELSEALRAEGVPPSLALASEFLVPDPVGASRATDLIPLLGFVGPGIRRGLGGISGVTDDAGLAVPVAHGTNKDFVIPKPSKAGLHGPGFYFAEMTPQTPGPLINEFNEYAGYDDGARVIPGFMGARANEVLRPEQLKVSWLNDEQQEVFRDLLKQYGVQEGAPGTGNKLWKTGPLKYDTSYDMSHNALDQFLKFEVDDDDERAVLEMLGFKGRYDAERGIGTLLNPTRDFLPAYDVDRQVAFLENNADALPPEVFNEAMEELGLTGLGGMAGSRPQAILGTGSRLPAARRVQPGKREGEPIVLGQPLHTQRVGPEEIAYRLKQAERPAGRRTFSEPNPLAQKLADQYKRGLINNRLDYDVDGVEQGIITGLDVDHQKLIADAFENAENQPSEELVQRAYEAMAEETIDQYRLMADNGIEFELWDKGGEPYANSAEMIEDVKNNNRMYILSTESDFGQEGITAAQRQENPLLRESGFKDVDGNPLLVNDVFRGVHDFFGHNVRGNSFGPIGEENAWAEHATMYSPLARRAMTTETRGQNSWVNFGPHMRDPETGVVLKPGDEGYLPVTERPFSEQKMTLLPEWVSRPLLIPKEVE